MFHKRITMLNFDGFSNLDQVLQQKVTLMVNNCHISISSRIYIKNLHRMLVFNKFGLFVEDLCTHMLKHPGLSYSNDISLWV